MASKFGNNNALQVVRKCGLYLISKLLADSALYFRNDGSYAGCGAPRKYGDKVNYAQLPDGYGRTAIETGIWT